jgi:peptidoglycan hydrolase CwlO-like protein
MAWEMTYGHHRELAQGLRRVERILDNLVKRGVKIMSAMDDLKSSIQKVADSQDALAGEADTIKTGINALVAAQQAGDQAAIDAAVQDIQASVSSLQGHVDTAKQHLDAAQAALPATGGATPTV